MSLTKYWIYFILICVGSSCQAPDKIEIKEMYYSDEYGFLNIISEDSILCYPIDCKNPYYITKFMNNTYHFSDIEVKVCRKNQAGTPPLQLDIDFLIDRILIGSSDTCFYKIFSRPIIEYIALDDRASIITWTAMRITRMPISGGTNSTIIKKREVVRQFNRYKHSSSSRFALDWQLWAMLEVKPTLFSENIHPRIDTKVSILYDDIVIDSLIINKHICYLRELQGIIYGTIFKDEFGLE